MRIRRRLQRLEQRAATQHVAGEAASVEIWIPVNGRGDVTPGRYPCKGTPNTLIIYEPQDEIPRVSETSP